MKQSAPISGASSPTDVCMILISDVVLGVMTVEEILVNLPELVPESFLEFFALSYVIRTNYSLTYKITVSRW